MKTLREYIADAEMEGKAIGHFNIGNLEGFWAVVGAARELNVPVIIGVSEGERDFIGIKQAKALVDSVRAEGQPVFINADHTYSVDRVKEVVDAGYDSVIIDGAKLPYEENLAQTKAAVEYARSVHPNILVEAELGYIGTSSKILTEVPEGVGTDEKFLTQPDQAREFVKATGLDLLAPAIGNMHGMMKGGKNPGHLNAERVKEVRDAAGIPLVLHGGSGSSEEDFVKVIKAGISIVHISTELRFAYRTALEETLKNNPDELAPYRLLQPVVDAMKAVVKKKLELFNS